MPNVEIMVVIFLDLIKETVLKYFLLRLWT